MRVFGLNIESEQTRLQRESMVFEAGRDAGFNDIKALDSRNSEDEIDSLQHKVKNWEQAFFQAVATLSETLGYEPSRPTSLTEAHRQFANINAHCAVLREERKTTLRLKQTAQRAVDAVVFMAPVLKAKADGKALTDKLFIAKARGSNHHNVIRVQDVKDLLTTAYELQKEIG